jgi:hypothetical protein
MRSTWMLAPLLLVVGCMTTADFEQSCAQHGYTPGTQAFFSCVQSAQADYNCAIANVTHMGDVPPSQAMLVTDQYGNQAMVQVQPVAQQRPGCQ